MRAADVMTRTVATVRADTPLKDAIKRMVDSRISGLPVTDAAGKLVGILTEGDLLRRTETGTGRKRAGWLEFLLGPNKAAAEFVRTHSRRVEDVMTPDVLTVTEDATLDDIVELMERKHVKRVPVVRGDALIGVVSRADLIKAVGLAMAGEDEAPLGDVGIRERLEAELQGKHWGGAESVNITVLDGVVSLEGVVFNQGLRPALRVAAQNIPGVKAVEDHLVWVEPVTGMSLGA